MMLKYDKLNGVRKSYYIERHFNMQQGYKISEYFMGLHSQKKAVRHLSSLLDIRRTLLEELQTAALSSSGPSLDKAPPGKPGEQLRLVINRPGVAGAVL